MVLGGRAAPPEPPVGMLASKVLASQLLLRRAMWPCRRHATQC